MASPRLSGRPTFVRYLVVVLCALMAVLLYLDRFCVSFAADYIREDLSLSQTQMSWFLSAFFWSYALAQVPSGWLSDRYGARIMLTVYILSWSFFTLMIGAAASFVILLLMRLACGLGQAGAYPTSGSVVSKWIPFTGRGGASSVIAFGGRIGGAIAPLLTATLIVVLVPMSVSVSLKPNGILDGRGPALCAKMAPVDSSENEPDEDPEPDAPKITEPAPSGLHVLSLFPDDIHAAVKQTAEAYREAEETKSAERIAEVELSQQEREQLTAEIDGLLDRPDLYNESAFQDVNLPREAMKYRRRVNRGETLSSPELRRFNRLLLEGAFREEIAKLYVHGWRPVMYIYGALGLLVAGLFWIFFRDRPEQHPWSNEAEQQMIAVGRPVGAPSPHGKAGVVPLGRLIKSRSMWFMCFSQVGTNIGWVFLVTWLPRYLLEVHEVPIEQRGWMASIPLGVGFVGMLFGGLFTDLLVRRVGLRWGRRFPMMITRFTAAFAYVCCLFFATAGAGSWMFSPWMFVAAFSLVAFSTDMGTGASWAFNQDVGGRYVGSVLGWGNMWGNLGASVSPLIYNSVLGEHPTIADWNTMFGICLAAFVFAGLCALGIDATIPIAPPDEEA